MVSSCKMKKLGDKSYKDWNKLKKVWRLKKIPESKLASGNLMKFTYEKP